MEHWRGVVGFEDTYLISNLGNVFSVRAKRVLKPMLTGSKRKQYAVVRLRTIPRIDKKIHQLVLETFVGPKPKGFFACHKNDDTTDNRLINLEWGSHKHNAVTASKNKAYSGQKLGVKECREILKLRQKGVAGKDLAVAYGVSPQRICDIYKRRSALI